MVSNNSRKEYHNFSGMESQPRAVALDDIVIPTDYKETSAFQALTKLTQDKLFSEIK
jgi:hypothetical protein